MNCLVRSRAQRARLVHGVLTAVSAVVWLAILRPVSAQSQPSVPPRSSTKVVLQIIGTNDVFKLGDAILFQFIVRKEGSNNYIYDEPTKDGGRLAQYKLFARGESGEIVADPFPTNQNAADVGYSGVLPPGMSAEWLGGGGSARNPGRFGTLLSGEAHTNDVLLNSWAWLKEPGRYEITGVYTAAYQAVTNAVSAPVTITVQPRSPQEMTDFVQELTNRVAERLALQANRAVKAYDSELHELVTQLLCTRSPEIVPTLFRVIKNTSHEGRSFYQALANYLPHTAEIKQALTNELNVAWDVENPDFNTMNWLRFTLRHYAVSNEPPVADAGPTGNAAAIVVEIHGPSGVVKAGDEIPIEFIVSNLGTSDYQYQDQGNVGNGRSEECQLSARQTNGLPLADPRQNAGAFWSGGISQNGVLHPGESYAKVIPLNSWALVKEGGEYEVGAIYAGRSAGMGMRMRGDNGPVQVRAAPLALTVLPRTEAEMADYIAQLTNQAMARLTEGPPPPTNPANQDLENLVMKLSYTCRPEIVPALLQMLRVNSLNRSGNVISTISDALMYYVPRSPSVGKAIIDAAIANGRLGNFQALLSQFHLNKEDLKPLVARALAAPDDSQAEWHNGAYFAANIYYDDSFTTALTNIAANPDAPIFTRQMAIQALAFNRTDAGVRMIRTLLNDPDPQLWTPLAIALQNGYQVQTQTPLGRHLHPYDFNSADVRPLLKRMLVSANKSDNMFGAGLAALFGDDAFTLALVSLANDPQNGARYQAINALALNRSEEGLKALKALLNGPDAGAAAMTGNAIRQAYNSRGDARGRPLLPGDFDPKYGAPVIKPDPNDFR
jgi:hypothetical protein